AAAGFAAMGCQVDAVAARDPAGRPVG
ncbi:MAG: hypothetical protein K0S88_6458, partial [Actinomycetia bacterium]|nr:hypothetical protein [Actinomycetes bacterium]